MRKYYGPLYGAGANMVPLLYVPEIYKRETGGWGEEVWLPSDRYRLRLRLEAIRLSPDELNKVALWQLVLTPW